MIERDWYVVKDRDDFLFVKDLKGNLKTTLYILIKFLFSVDNTPTSLLLLDHFDFDSSVSYHFWIFSRPFSWILHETCGCI